MGWIESALRTTQVPGAPAAEARQAHAELFAHVVQSITHRDLTPPDEVRAFLGDLDRNDTALAKAVTLSPRIDATGYPAPYGDRRGHQAILYANELGIQGQIEPWAEKQTYGSGFDLLRQVAEVDAIQAIVGAMVRQAVPYARQYREDDNNPFGMRLVRRDKQRLTRDDDKEAARLWDILENSGTESDPIVRRWTKRRRSFSGFIAALLYDSLMYDACPVETERARSGQLLGWYNVDPTTVRLAYEEGYEGNDRIVAVQLDPTSRQPLIGFEADELLYEVRRPRSSIFQYDYGHAELESYLRAVTYYLNCMTFAGAALDRNSMPRGFMTIFGNFDQKQMTDVKQRWAAQMLGVSNRWRMPIMVSKDRQSAATWTPIDTAGTEPLYTKLVTIALSIGCALWGVSPELINSDSFSSKTSSLSGSDTKEKAEGSHNRGQIPNMLWLLGVLNQGIIAPISPQVGGKPKYELTVVGLFPDDEERKHERQLLTLTTNEGRDIDGEKPHPDPDIGNAPLNQALMPIYMLKLNQKLGIPNTPDGQPGQPGTPGGPESSANGGEHRDILPRSDAPPQDPRDAAEAKPDRGPRDLAKADAPRLVVEIRRIENLRTLA